MTLLYAIDRFDGDDWAVLENDAARTFSVPRSWLPAGACSGDVVKIDAQAGREQSTLSVSLDPDEKANRVRSVEERRQQLPQGPRGDVLL